MPADLGTGGGAPARPGEEKDPYLSRLDRMKNY